MNKPSYSTTRRWMLWSFLLGWMLIWVLVIAALLGNGKAIELAPIVIPSAFLQIAALMGIHRFSGSMDFAAASGAVPPPEPPYLPRDQPATEDDAR